RPLRRTVTARQFSRINRIDRLVALGLTRSGRCQAGNGPAGGGRRSPANASSTATAAGQRAKTDGYRLAAWISSGPGLPPRSRKTGLGPATSVPNGGVRRSGVQAFGDRQRRTCL